MRIPDAAFRCSSASVLRDEPLVGTASHVRAFLLVEHPGPWGEHALRDARLPDALGPALLGACVAARVRPLLVRRPGRRPATAGIRVFAAYADPVRPWLEGTILADPHRLLDLDLAALGAGRTTGLPGLTGPLLCVCTHGRHDACCAERGRPVATALAEAHPEDTWEVSHIGGDRFAGNLLVLPHGLYYGRLAPASALAAAAALTTGELDLDHLRGRSGHPMPVQVAELALRRVLAETREGAVRLVGRRVAGGVTGADFDVAGTTWTVRVRSTPGATPEQLTCRAAGPSAAPLHEVLEVARARAGAQ